MRYELTREIFYLDPKRSAEDKEHGSFPAAVFKTKEQQESGQALFQAYQVVQPFHAKKGNNRVSRWNKKLSFRT